MIFEEIPKVIFKRLRRNKEESLYRKRLGFANILRDNNSSLVSRVEIKKSYYCYQDNYLNYNYFSPHLKKIRGKGYSPLPRDWIGFFLFRITAFLFERNLFYDVVDVIDVFGTNFFN